MKTSIKFEIYVGLVTNTGATISEATINSLKDLYNSRLSGITITNGLGVWQGIEEPALIITHIGDESETETVIQLAKITRINLNQDAVLVTATEIKTLLLDKTNSLPKFYTYQQLQEMDLVNLHLLANKWGKLMPEAQRFKKEALIQFIEKKE